MTIRLQRKLPNEVLTYLHNWAPFLGDDTIATETTTAAGVAVGDVSVQAGNQSIKFTISGGVLGTVGKITQSITTAAGLQETETFTIPVSSDEPVSRGEVKQYLGLFSDDRDGAIDAMIPRARLWVEDYTGLALTRRQFTELRRTEHNTIRLFKGPLVSVDSTTYGDALSYVPAYSVPDSRLRAVAGSAWPTLDDGDAFEITYTAGFAEGEVDDRLIGAMLALIEGEFSEGYAYPQRATDAAERCCSFLRESVL